MFTPNFLSIALPQQVADPNVRLVIRRSRNSTETVELLCKLKPDSRSSLGRIQESAGIDTKRGEPFSGFVVKPGTLISATAIARAAQTIPGFVLPTSIPDTNVIPNWIREGHDLISYESLTTPGDRGQFVWEIQRANDIEGWEAVSGERILGRLIIQN